jgi:hypothetical protein
MLAKHATIPALALFLGLCSAANATPLIDTVGLGGDATRTLNSIGSTAESFIADSTSIGDIQLELARTGATTGSVVVTLYSDNSDTLGSPIAGDAIQTVQESAIPGAESLFDFHNISLATQLVAGTRYWVDVIKSGTVSSEVFTTTGTPVYGVGSTGMSTNPDNTTYYKGTSVPSTSPLMAICISDDNSCETLNTASVSYNEGPAATPEPASAAIIGAGLAGIGFARRRRNSKK